MSALSLIIVLKITRRFAAAALRQALSIRSDGWHPDLNRCPRENTRRKECGRGKRGRSEICPTCHKQHDALVQLAKRCVTNASTAPAKLPKGSSDCPIASDIRP